MTLNESIDRVAPMSPTELEGKRVRFGAKWRGWYPMLCAKWGGNLDSLGPYLAGNAWCEIVVRNDDGETMACNASHVVLAPDAYLDGTRVAYDDSRIPLFYATAHLRACYSVAETVETLLSDAALESDYPDVAADYLVAADWIRVNEHRITFCADMCRYRYRLANQ